MAVTGSHLPAMRFMRITRAVTRSGWRLNGSRSLMRAEARQRPAPGVFALSGPLGLSTQLMLHRPKRGFAPGRTATTRKGQTMPLYEHVFLARQDISQAQVEALTKEYTRGHRRRRRQGRQDRVLGPQDPRLQDQEEPQGALLADEHRRAAGRGGGDGAAHGPLARRHPLHDHPRRRARDRALDPDAQERPRRPPRRRSRRLPRRRSWRLPRRRRRRLPRRRWRRLPQRWRWRRRLPPRPETAATAPPRAAARRAMRRRPPDSEES